VQRVLRDGRPYLVLKVGVIWWLLIATAAALVAAVGRCPYLSLCALGAGLNGFMLPPYSFFIFAW